MSNVITTTAATSVQHVVLQKKKEEAIKKLKARSRSKKVTATRRWRKPMSWDKTRNARRLALREKQKEQGEEEKKHPRKKNHTLHQHRAKHYTQGAGQQGIGIPFARARRNIEKSIVIGMDQLQALLGPDFHHYIYTDYVDTIRAALDQYINRVLEVAQVIASGREKEETEHQPGQKRKRGPKGVKCRPSDFTSALNMVNNWDK